MTREELVRIIREKRSLLCVGLDTEEHLLPESFRSLHHPVRAFNHAIIEATHHLAVAYKLNSAFYEAQGAEGWHDMESAVALIKKVGGCFTIADAKRGDIGNTARKYAEAFFTNMGFDAITLSPYMGRDSVTPFLGQAGKWAVVLAATSNAGADDLQFLRLAGTEEPLFQRVLSTVAGWGTPKDTMFVVGGTRPEVLKQARDKAPDHFFLVPGIGAQGGDLQAVLEAGITAQGGLLVNSSRGILQAGTGDEAVPKAREAAKALQRVMEAALRKKGVI